MRVNILKTLVISLLVSAFLWAAPLTVPTANAEAELIEDLDQLSDEELMAELFAEDVAEEDKYKPLTFQDLARLYWASGRFQFDDIVSLDSFLKITECQLYNQFVYDDFEWEAVREAAKVSIQANKSSYQKHFEFLLPITLGRYDVGREVFEVSAGQIDSVRKFEFRTVDGDGRGNSCLQGKPVLNYESQVYLTLNRPFAFKEFPVPKAIATIYLDDLEKMYQDMPAELRMKRYQRSAFLRLKMRFLSYRGTERSSAGNYASFFGILEGYEVYADQKMTRLLYKEDVEYKKRSRKKRTPAQENPVNQSQ